MNRQTILLESNGIIGLERPRPDGKPENYEALQIVYSPGQIMVYQAYYEGRVRLCRMLTGPASTFVIFGAASEFQYRSEDVEIVYDTEKPERCPYRWGVPEKLENLSGQTD